MDDSWYWLIWLLLAVGLVVGELFTGTFVFLMLATGAAAAALTGVLGGGLGVQALVFTLVSVFTMIGVRPYVRKRLHRQAESAPMGLEAIEGSSGLVLEKVDQDTGLIKIGGEMWSARSYDASQVIEPGERVRVIEVKGAVAMVWREA